MQKSKGVQVKMPKVDCDAVEDAMSLCAVVDVEDH